MYIFCNYGRQCICVHLLVFTEDTDLRKNVQIICSVTMACFEGHDLNCFILEKEGEKGRESTMMIGLTRERSEYR
jgi:hypothetical protein